MFLQTKLQERHWKEGNAMMEHTNPTHRIRIIYDPDLEYESHKHVVRPGHQYVSAGDKVIFKTMRTAARIFFPKAAELFVELKDNWITVEENDQSDPLTIKDGSSGKYAYVAYCNNGEDFAEGGSTPRIIVEG